MSRKRISVTKQTTSGQNTRFHDYFNNTNMTKAQFVSQIKAGNYPNYHIRVINGIATPVSNPDAKKKNNLG